MRKKINAHSLLGCILLILILAFIMYRICFNVFLGQPLEMGNIPSTAPNIFRLIKNILIYTLGISPVVLVVYYLITWNKFRKKQLRKTDLYFAMLIAIIYSIFWFSDSGSVWLFW